jgi:hypothetical protein
MKETKLNKIVLSKFGFNFDGGGAHTARTMMLKELQDVLSYVANIDARRSDYLHAIKDDNCLCKRSTKTRALSYHHLVELYSLDHETLLFQALRYFWTRDIAGQPLLALLCVYARDPILRSSADFILKHPQGSDVSRQSVEEYIDSLNPDHFSQATLKSVAQNINSTWTQSGHLFGKVRKTRKSVTPTAGSVAYALLLGYLTGIRGQALFESDFVALLDCAVDRAIELAEEASRKGWIIVKRLGDVIEVDFTSLITQKELELLH